MRRRANGNVAAVSHGQHVPTPTAAQRDALTQRPSGLVTTTTSWPWFSSRVWIGYLCVNFGLPMPLCYRLRPDMYATDRQTSDSIIALCPRILGAGHINVRDPQNFQTSGHQAAASIHFITKSGAASLPQKSAACEWWDGICLMRELDGNGPFIDNGIDQWRRRLHACIRATGGQLIFTVT